MKELLLQFSAYNVWANGLMLDAIGKLPEEMQHRTIASSFDSPYKTLLHLWDAESLWWQRMKLQERVVRPSDNFSGTVQELGRQLLLQSRQWNDWITQAHEPQLQHVFKYQDSRRESFKQPVAQVLLHIFNHATYHRGQLVTMMRQLGIEKVPNTDFIGWTRKK